MNETTTRDILQKLNSLSTCLDCLENSLRVILDTPECSCEHNVVSQAQKIVFDAITLLSGDT